MIDMGAYGKGRKVYDDKDLRRFCLIKTGGDTLVELKSLCSLRGVEYGRFSDSSIAGFADQIYELIRAILDVHRFWGRYKLNDVWQRVPVSKDHVGCSAVLGLVAPRSSSALERHLRKGRAGTTSCARIGGKQVLRGNILCVYSSVRCMYYSLLLPGVLAPSR
jgi:hypothetical protein